MWCGVCAKNTCDVGRGVGSLSLNPLRMFMLNQRTFSCFTALFSVEFSSICIHISNLQLAIFQIATFEFCSKELIIFFFGINVIKRDDYI